MKHIGNLSYAEGSKHKRKRIGRGEGSGYGGTSTKGHKGQKSRAGYKKRRGFEGGQMPMHRRLPKFGFTNRFRTEYEIVNVGRLQELIDAGKVEGKVDVETLANLGAVKTKDSLVKILGSGDLTASLEVKAHKFSNSAKSKIESAGGTAALYE